MKRHASKVSTLILTILALLFLGASACEERTAELPSPALPTAGGLDRAALLAEEQAGQLVAAAVRHEYERLVSAQPALRDGAVLLDPVSLKPAEGDQRHPTAITDRVIAEMNARLVRRPDEHTCLFTPDADCPTEPIGVIVRHLAPSLDGDSGSVRLGLTYALDAPAHRGVAFITWIEVRLESRGGVWEVVGSEVQSVGTLGPPPPWER